MKRRIEDLACFGGPPAFRETLHVGRPNIGDRQQFLKRVEDILDRRWLTNHGRYVQEFEERIADLVGVRHAIAMCNATVGLEIAIRALDLRGEVIVPSMTFVATAHALHWQGIRPVFCDVEPHTFNLDPDRVEELIGPATTGILGVHLWGRPRAVERLEEIARRRGLGLLFDAAHAFACSYRGRSVGTLGDAEVFSFHATKFFNTFEGGAVVTDNDELAARIRLMKNFGFAGYDEVVYVGTNGKMSEVSAAMGLTGLESLDGFVAANRRNYEAYDRELRGLRGVRPLPYDARERNNFQYVVVELDPGATGIGRDALYRLLWAENVRARRYFYPGCHRMEPYRTLFPGVGGRLPVTERAVERVLTLPTGTAVSPDDIGRIVALVRFALEHGPAIEARLAAGAGAR